MNYFISIDKNVLSDLANFTEIRTYTYVKTKCFSSGRYLFENLSSSSLFSRLRNI